MRSRAQSMVEFAIMASLFFLLVLGIVDFGRAVWNYNTVAFLARDGARRAEVSSTINTYLIDRCHTMLSPTCSMSASSPPPNAAHINVTGGACGEVTVAYAFQPASMMIANLWGGGTLQLQATSRTYVEPAQPGGCPS